MAVVTCPKCPTSLRIPDGVSGHVKCPKCNALFPVSASAGIAPKTAAVPPPKPAPAKSPPPPPPAKKASESPDFEVLEDAPKLKKRITASEDDYEEDEPRKKKRDDDDDDRSRKKKKAKRYDDDDDDDWQPSSRNKKGFNKARIGVLLFTISSWMYFSLYVLFTLGVFLLLMGVLVADDSPRAGAAPVGRNTAKDIATVVNFILMLIGLVGLANWIISLIGFSFCIAGPERARTGAIAVTAISGVHLVFVGLSYGIATSQLKTVGQFSGIESPTWILFATTMPFLNSFLPMLVYGYRSIDGEFIVLILTSVCEVIRLIFSLLMIRTLAHVSKNEGTAEKAQIGVVASSILIGGGMILMLLIVLLLAEAKFSNFKTPITIGIGTLFLLCLAYTVMLLIPALTAASTLRSLGQRNR